MAAAPLPPMSAPVPAPEAAPLSQGARIVDTFIAPSKTFTDLRRSAQWWLPFLLMTFAGWGLVYVSDSSSSAYNGIIAPTLWRGVPQPGIEPGRPELGTRLQSGPDCQFQHWGIKSAECRDGRPVKVCRPYLLRAYQHGPYSLLI